MKKGDFDRYLAENIQHAQAHGVPPAAFEPLPRAYAAAGIASVRNLFLARAEQQLQAFPAMQMAVFYGEVGRAIESRDPSLVHLAVAPQWDTLRGDPRFHECLARMGLPVLDYKVTVR